MTRRSTAQTDAATIRDEVSAGANTATRVGAAIRELADYCAFTEDVGSTICSFSDSRVSAYAAQQDTSWVQVYNATFATGTTQPTVLTDASMTGLSAGGKTSGVSTGTLGVVAGSFASSGAETGTGSGQGGLGSAANASQPYNSTDFPGGLWPGLITKNGRAVLLREMLSSALLDLDAEVIPFFAYRSDASANNKWRVWWYYRRAADGLLAPFTPDTSVTSATLSAPQVTLLSARPASAGFTNGVAGAGALEMTAGLVGDLQALGTAAIGTTGRYMDAGTVLQMPSANQLAACTGDVSLSSHKLTNVTDGTNAQDAATFNMLRTVRAPTAKAHSDSPYALAAADEILQLDSSTGTIQVNLPNPNTNRKFMIKDVGGAASTSNITLHRNGSEKIENVAADKTLTLNYGAWLVWSDGTNWWISGSY